MPAIASISQQIWDMKYRLKGPDGAAVDKTIEDSWRRVASALAEPERDKAAWAERFYQALADFKFLPAGRVLAGAGSGRSVTLFNCFVMGTIPDDMSGYSKICAKPRSPCSRAAASATISRRSGPRARR